MVRPPQVHDKRTPQDRRRVATVTTSVHADRSADRTWDAHVELEAGESGAGGATRQDRQRDSSTGTDGRRPNLTDSNVSVGDRHLGNHNPFGGASPVDGHIDIDRVERRPEHDDNSIETRVGDQKVRTPPDHRHLHRRRLPQDRRNLEKVMHRVRSNQHT